METIGPVTRRNATGPLRRLFWSREKARPALQGQFWTYAIPLGLLGLIGLGFAAGAALDGRGLDRLWVVIIAVGSVLPVVITFRLPVLAWRAGFLMLFLGSLQADPKESWPWNTVQLLGFLVVLGRLAVSEESALTIWAVAFSLIPVFVYSPYANAWGAAVLLVAIAALGDIVSRRRRTRALLAEKEELTELERAKRAVLEERTRIAREMHDVVAHHMSMIAVRAETAPYRVGDLPDSAKEELATIAGTAREALTDMRRLLGVLRAEEGDAPLTPQPGFAEVATLVETARGAGLTVELTVTDVADLPETVGLAAYRIVQEALANAARHAPGGPVTVDARGFPERIELTVRNKLIGPVPAAHGHGHGLAGMRERAELLGGTLSAAAEDDHFVVWASLPRGEQS
ncbi:sensor histidine kinase [Paractinoplanes lichenicola]|uniref:sensor histidine kinase n=1 Tax=Paractinoplanes lichenicola TaxID=2802976 RepID=UPI0027DD4E2C|nr:histidine kinase [Actinoplanes lichenicola]